MTTPPLLVLGVGNPSRGDDALGPRFVERAAASLAGEIAAGRLELLTDFQLQIEHALDLTGRRRVLFVDASVQAAPPFELRRVEANRDPGATSHAMSPAAVLGTHRDVIGEPPEAWVLEIRGERFELGDELSVNARAHLDAALAFFVREARADTATAELFVREGRTGTAPAEGRRLELEGTVQGVGVRPWLQREARALGLTGRVLNSARGVTVEAFGPAPALDELVRALQQRLPGAARLRTVRATAIALEPGLRGFAIAASSTEGTRRLSLPPDLAACPACLAEVDDPKDRHHGYAFTSCTACGPRFAIADTLPYDRARTTMAGFALCPACASEYADPDDRRFHAQTVACPACGPRLWLTGPDGIELPAAHPLDEAAARLRAGAILAVQGLGAFHLLCDATREDVVAELRRRKRRELRPFAIMVADLAGAEAVAVLDDHARAALTSSARPIVLAPARPGALAPAVNGPSRRVGVMLPATPLQHLLLARVGAPLVTTSGNRSGAPAEIDHAGARARLAGLVDGFLLHDRRIARRVEDSVLSIAPAGPRVVRRARGLSPEPIRLPAPSPAPVLAVGGHLKNTICIVVDDLAYLGPHLGDLETVEGEAAWQADLTAFERLLRISPEVVAHDLHPGYATTRLALNRPAHRHIGVQHHLAHVQAAIAELHLDEPVIGVVYDGSGWGPDATSWGGEVLLVDGPAWWRLASFRPLPLAGGERAVRSVWRQALAALHEAFGDEALALAARLPLFAAVPPTALATVARMLAARVEVMPARGVGRWFDAIGALALGLPEAGFEGHVAIALEEAVVGDGPAYPVGAPTELAPVAAAAVPAEIDLRPTVRAVVDDLLAGVTAPVVAARFHRTLIDATARVVEQALATTGARLVVPTGGVFQNQVLGRGLARRLGADRVRTPREVPVNDGGLALGQAWTAVLALRAAERR